MRKSIPLAVLAALALTQFGCANMTPRQKKLAAFAGGVLVVGAIAAHKADRGDSAADGDLTNPARPPCYVQPDGSCR